MFRTSVRRYFHVGAKAMAACVCAAVLLMMGGCNLIFKEETSDTSGDSTSGTVSASTVLSETDTTGVTGSSDTSSASDGSADPSASSESSEETSASETEYSNPESMYSSYAHMVSFDPVNGLARFDYFDMLKGQAAIDWLVAHEGYTVADATALVNDFADSEFVYKNINPQLRTADMSEVDITMMYHSDGTQVPGAETVSLTYAQFVTLYSGHSSAVLESFFYYVTVSGGEITKVDQVYWP